MYFILIIKFNIAGVLGIKVKIMLPWDPNGKNGPKRPLPDNVIVQEPKEEIIYTVPASETKVVKDINVPPPIPVS